MKPYIYLNPKNNLKTAAEYQELLDKYQLLDHDVTLFVPPLLLQDIKTQDQVLDNRVTIGVQGLRLVEAGGTGSVDPNTVLDLGVTVGLVGHSDERRAGMSLGEVLEVIQAAPDQISLVVCIGEERPEAQSMETFYQELKELAKIVAAKNNNIYVAYEPMWLISTNKDEVYGLTHDNVVTHCARTIEHIRQLGCKTVLYGGSVSDFTTTDLRAFNADGFLIGSLSLDPEHLGEFINSLF